MTTESPHGKRALAPTLSSVPTPRSGVPTTGFGVSAINTRPELDRPVEEPERRSRAVLVAGALVAAAAVVAAVVAFRIMVPSIPSAEAAGASVAREEVRERPGSVVMFGQVHTYGDGLEIAVNPPQRYEPSGNATGVEGGVPVKMQVVVTNRTDAAFRPNTVQVSATSAGQPGTAIWDPDQGIALTGPDVSIPAGASLHFNLAFTVADPGDVTVELTPALFGYGPTVVQR
ncbi:hypothetical protein Cfla_0157 [Cellulomonas flavigena DSM 20109]|uniref:DUF4352 domain-containing protein n=1 Tax=Cellulomonas flavigena (strain ATCC 482 / DSM 20109 / BCRC 11376 / JCM 18109 / NBRC 3775 / NCIMB 8073 / NRS 134) TaxID=446466 RepID=D5UG93_CELFN|nr:hypothetical protein [Cellulomonas flavigena]ADG73076.1 hypothetical protein Cfla_0157 [Cellulomonas flavigena DSM 20109]